MTAEPHDLGGAKRRWRLVRTHPQREIVAEGHLQRQGFEVFLPKTVKTVRHARRLQQRIAAFFPCYLFLSLDATRQRWRCINGTFGVSHLVMCGDTPAAVPDGVVEDLIACSDQLGLYLPPSPAPGQKVRILAGPFSGQIAMVQRLDAAGRVRLLLDIMGGTVSARADHLAMVAA
ncbi:MAG: transcriptional activator RfaH [Caulobacteraceae bacterium]|nr:transcriptional activator RfaH [Caulobacteraceae bacterium]